MAYSFKGNLSFGFVYIPITLHLATQDSSIAFRLFDSKTKSKIQYKKTCVECNNREVKNEDIIRGYEYEDGKYVTLTNDEFEKLKTPKDKNITLEQFVDLKEIDPLYLDKSYYVVPNGANKPFCLLLKILEEENKAGLGKTVLGTKEVLVLVRSVNKKMILSTLFFNEEIKPYPLELNFDAPSAAEVKMAKLLIKEMTAPFDPTKYHDEYAKRVKKAIEDKIKGRKIITPKKEPEVKIVDLMEALKSSIQELDTKKVKKKLLPNKDIKKSISNDKLS